MNKSTLNSAGHILLVAKNAYLRSATTEKYDALSSIILSAVGLECFVNEFAEHLRADQLHQNSKALNDVEFALEAIERCHGSLRTKIDAISFYLMRARVNWGHAPFQDLAFLLSLRNKLVHRKPERFDYDFEYPDRDYTPHDDVAFLVSRKVISAPNSKNPPQWSAYVVCPETAQWAFNTVVDTIHWIVKLIPHGNAEKVLQMLVRDLEHVQTPVTDQE